MSKLFIIVAILVFIGGTAYYVQQNVSLEDAMQSLGQPSPMMERDSTTGSMMEEPMADSMGKEMEKKMEEEVKEKGEGIMDIGADETVIRYTADGFVPSSLMVKRGTAVTFKNESSRVMWPASAQHPTHSVYPGSDIKKCGISRPQAIFDACREIPPGGEWSFRFDQTGKWFYHDHLMSSKFGSITVEE